MQLNFFFLRTSQHLNYPFFIWPNFCINDQEFDELRINKTVQESKVEGRSNPEQKFKMCRIA